MLQVRLICIGKLKESYWREAVKEYEKRLTAFCRFEVVELGECKLPDAPSQAMIDAALEKEGDQILAQVKGLVFPLCVEGKQCTSPVFGEKLAGAMQSPGAVSFVIGSSHGLSPLVKQAGEKLSMSLMTFPHQLARVMLCEQIYRGFQILQGSKYHK